MIPTEFKTRWALEPPPYGAFDDYIIFESLTKKNKFLIRPEEVDFLMSKIFDKWQEQKISYIQILQEWNECLNFWNIEQKPTIIKDLFSFIEAIKLVKGADNNANYGVALDTDIRALEQFLNNHKEEGILMKEE